MEEESCCFYMSVVAKVMAMDSGTPALKSGVKLLSRCTEMMSDANTDWEGFS